MKGEDYIFKQGTYKCQKCGDTQVYIFAPWEPEPPEFTCTTCRSRTHLVLLMELHDDEESAVSPS